MTRQPGQRANHWRRVSGALVSGVGTIMALIHSYQLLAEAPNALSAVVSGIVIPLCISLLLISAGFWLAQSDHTGKHAVRVAGWSIVGAAILTFSAVSMTQYRQALGVALDGNSVILANSVTGGTAIGFVFGIYATRIKRQTVRLDQYRQELKRERDQFVALFNNLPNPAIQYDHADDEPVIRIVNPAFERVFGTDAASINSTPVDAVITPPDDEQEPIDLDTALRSGQVVQHETRLNTAAGLRDFQLLFIPTRIATTESRGYIIATDVTDRNQYIRRLEVLNRVLRHDLRNEANVIIGYAGMLQDENCELTKAKKIRETAYGLVELGDTARQIEHALDRSSETGGSIVLTGVLHNCIDCARKKYPNADIQTEIPEGIQVNVNEQIDSVFDNVIENAIEHNDSESPLVSIAVTTSDPDFVTVEIADNGPGFPDRERQVLEQGTETQLKHSLGLGLWLVNWIIVDSGGKVTFEDNDPQGSVVAIDLPKPDSHPYG
jgi:PAS domain S-box-containing protein